VRVLLADDHVPMRKGTRLALERAGFDVVAECGTADAAIAAAKRTRPDVCVLDVRMPGDGVRAAAEIAARLPATKVVMLTVSRDDADLFSALRAGAVGYLLKDIDPERLPGALRGVLRGEAALPLDLVARLLEEFRARNHRGLRRRFLVAGAPAELTEREWDVLESLGDSLTTAEIAQRLLVSEVTVRTHVSTILRKLQLPNRQAARELIQRER
jgi:DNA-binding NarL/FixJ family response regulator